MIVRVLTFFIWTNLGAELFTSAYDENRYEKEIAVYPKGLAIHDGNGNLVELTTDRGAPSARNGEIIFTLFTKQRSALPRVLITNDTSSLIIGGFNTSKPTYIITHGWMNNGSSPACVRIRDGRFIIFLFILHNLLLFMTVIIVIICIVETMTFLQKYCAHV